jgi:hypothetical protein
MSALRVERVTTIGDMCLRTFVEADMPLPASGFDEAFAQKVRETLEREAARNRPRNGPIPLSAAVQGLVRR